MGVVEKAGRGLNVVLTEGEGVTLPPLESREYREEGNEKRNNVPFFFFCLSIYIGVANPLSFTHEKGDIRCV
jgi:hypothetical protein